MRTFLVKTIICSLLLTCAFSANKPHSAYASEPVSDPNSKAAVLGDFLKRMKSGYERSNLFLQDAGIVKKPLDLRGLPVGDLLIFELVLPGNIKLQNAVLGQVGENTILLSTRDFINVADFPIEYDPQTGNFSGWFIRENKTFSLNSETGLVQADGTEYKISSQAIKRDDDLLVPVGDIEAWFNMTIAVDVSTQQLKLDPQQALPIMEALKRKNFQARDFSRKPPSLPRGNDEYKAISTPLVDVSTRTSVRKQENSSRELTTDINLRTANEIAYGTLSTNVAIDDEEKLTNARVTYFQESAYPELLGPLEARRFEVGDLQPTRIPITGDAPPEQGVRITNTDPFVRQTLPSTQISGYIFPGWDVELYRDQALVAVQSTNEDGYYSFDNVRLFSDRNAFRVVAYGPQGEVREETVSVPYDPNREAIGSTVYDVSITRQNSQFYEKNESGDEDKNTPHFVGFLETPITDNAALRVGGRYRQEEGETKAYASAGLSSSYAGTLLNADLATDNNGELGAEFVATRQFGEHNFRADLALATDNYDPGGTSDIVQVLENRYALEGPLPIGLGLNPRYSTFLNYTQDSEGETSLDSFVNLNTQFDRLGFNQSFNYIDSSNDPEGVKLNSITSLSGSVGKNNFRGLANYEIMPESELESLTAFWRHRINQELESQFQVDRIIDTGVNRYSAQVNWRPEYATITPRLTYDSEGNTEATLNTRFGLTRIEETGDFVFSREFVTTTGTITAFVYLDKDGNKIFDGEDEPIPDATIQTPQNSTGAKTDENGIAFIPRLRPNLITDVFVDRGSLADPYWIPAEEGVSIMPRTGTNVKLEIPVHIAGEMDGTVYAKTQDGGTSALRNVSLALYNEKGEVEQRTQAGPDGFYIFSLIPPGKYSLLVDDKELPGGITRPRPQPIEIGYEGTTIYANDIVLTTGQEDVPTAIMADLSDYKALHPNIDFTNANYYITLNLGDYSSRLLTSLVWYRLKSRFAAIFKGTDLFVPPSQSYVDAKTGQHTLRVGLASDNIDDAYNRCRALIARRMYCKVEIYPALQKQAMAQSTAVQ